MRIFLTALLASSAMASFAAADELQDRALEYFAALPSTVPAVKDNRITLKGANHLPRVIEGVTFTEGVAATDTANRAA